MRMVCRTAGVAAWIAVLSVPIFPQATPVVLGQSIAALHGPWKFHAGDDSGWAKSQFDDSAWETVELAPARGQTGYAWYRLHVTLTPAQSGLKLLMPGDVDDAYQIYIDGRLLGGFGDFSKHPPLVYHARPVTFSVPDTGSSVTLAIRCWMAGGMHSSPQLGLARDIDLLALSAADDELRMHAVPLFKVMLFTSFTLLSFWLAWQSRADRKSLLPYMTSIADRNRLLTFERRARLNLLLAAACLLEGFYSLYLVVTDETHLLGISTASQLRDVLLRPALTACWLMLWLQWFQLERKAWLRNSILILAALNVVTNTALVDRPGPLAPAISITLRLLIAALFAVIASWGIRRQPRRAWLTLPGPLLFAFYLLDADLALYHFPLRWYAGGVRIVLADLASILLAGAFSAVMVKHFLEAQGNRQKIETEFRNATQVQRVIMPAPLAQFPGFRVQSVYRPAEEVGGDFFQVLATPHGGVLVVVGDVSGKGLQAAILVSLIVGAIRTAAETTSDPVAILSALNRVLCGRAEGGFATCLVLFIAANGDAKLANAGHLPPFVDKVELEMPGAIPLGMVQDAEFSEVAFSLAPGQAAVLISDGIVEARDPRGALFGFERLMKLIKSNTSPAALASAAQRFGQEDDITVISVQRVPASG